MKQETKKLLLKNKGLLLLSFNLVFATGIFFLYDPFILFSGSYQQASSLLSVAESDVEKIEIIDPSFKATLLRAEEIPSTEEKKPSLTKSKEKRYQWKLQTEKETYAADDDRIKELFRNIKDTRRYYSFGRNKELDADQGLTAESSESCNCRILRLYTGKKTEDILVGRSSLKDSSSYVRLNNEKNNYFVQTNLKDITGNSSDYFRSRRIFPLQMEAESITGILVQNGPAVIELSKAGGVWQIMKPVPAQASEAEVTAIVSDLAEMKAHSFPSEISGNIENKYKFKVTLTYRINLTQTATVKFEVAGRKDGTRYFIKDESGVLYEVHSTFLGDLIEVEKRLMQKQKPALQN